MCAFFFVGIYMTYMHMVSMSVLGWLVGGFSTHLKNIGQIGSSPQVRANILKENETTT